MRSLITEIKSIAKLVIDLGEKSIAIDWPIVTGKDSSDPTVREWLSEINKTNEGVKKECMAGSICRDIAEAKKNSRTFCLGCDFYPNGIDEDSQELLNKIISESGGRESVVNKSPKVVFHNSADKPEFLLAFNGIEEEKESSDRPTWQSRREAILLLKKEPIPEKEEIRKPSAGVPKKRGPSRKKYEIITEAGKVIPVSDEINSQKIKNFFTKWVRKNREESANLVAIRGSLRNNLFLFNAKVSKIFLDNGNAFIEISSNQKKKKNLSKLPIPTQFSSSSTPVSNSALTPALISAGREKLKTQFQRILDLPVEIDKEPEWYVITNIDSQRINKNGGAFLCHVRVGKGVIRRGVCSAKDLERIIQEESVKPIPGEVIVKELSLLNLCAALNDCIRIEAQREKDLL